MSHDSIRTTFDSWADQGHGESMEQEHGDVVAQVLSRLNVRPGFQILELGCGVGWTTRKLASAAPGVQAIGVDASPKMIARAEELSSLRIRARYECGTFEQLEFPDGKFDLAFSMEALYYAVDLERALAEICRVLKPGGDAHAVLDYYEGRAGTEHWSDQIGLTMHRLEEAGWRAAFEAAGFEAVETERVRDSRGPGDEAEWKAGRCDKDWPSHVAYHEAGSLWVHGRKP